MDISVKNQELTSILSNVLVLGVFEDDKNLNAAQKKVDTALNGLISEQLIKKEGFKGKFADSITVHTQLKIPSDKIMLVGLGKKKEFNSTKLTELASKIIKQLDKTLGAKNVSFELLGTDNKNITVEQCAYSTAVGILIGMYDYDKY